MMNPILTVNNLEKIYKNKGSLTRAISHISFEVEKGEYIGIMGASGSGKTTLLNCISTIDRATAGQICINGIEGTKMREKSLAQFRGEMFLSMQKIGMHRLKPDWRGVAYWKRYTNPIRPRCTRTRHHGDSPIPLRYSRLPRCTYFAFPCSYRSLLLCSVSESSCIAAVPPE